jgi:hypothetical protein
MRLLIRPAVTFMVPANLPIRNRVRIGERAAFQGVPGGRRLASRHK